MAGVFSDPRLTQATAIYTLADEIDGTINALEAGIADMAAKRAVVAAGGIWQNPDDIQSLNARLVQLKQRLQDLVASLP